MSSELQARSLGAEELRDLYGCVLSMPSDPHPTNDVGQGVSRDDAETLEEPKRFYGLAPLSHGSPQLLGFLANEKYLEEAARSELGGILCSSEHASKIKEIWTHSKVSRPLLFVSTNPYATFARVAQFFFKPDHGGMQGHSPRAIIDSTAEVHQDSVLFPNCFVGPGARIGARSVLYPGVFVGAASRIGEDCILYPNSVVREGCRLGDRCILNPGAVIGGDGFGFAPDGEENVKIPQIGGVVLGNDVEIGTNSSIDRGAMADTTLGAQTKIDSLVQIAHNVQVGKSCFIASLSAIAGSTKIGNRVTLAGQVGVVGHLTICDNVTVLAKSGVSKNIFKPGAYSGVPCVPNREYLVQTATLNRFLSSLKKPKE